MDFIIAQFTWILLVGGVLTMTVFYAAIAPRAALTSMFGEAVEGTLAEMVVRNWGALIGLTGAMMVWGAFHPETRPLILLVAGASKLVFSGLVLSQPRYRAKAAVPVMLDLVLVVLFAIYLAGTAWAASQSARSARRPSRP